MSDFRQLVPEHVRNLSGYTPGKSLHQAQQESHVNCIKMASNENPFGPSPKAVEAMQAADMPQGLPVGSWRGVSDRALYEQVIAHAEARNGIEMRAQYNFVLTLSGHSPFSRPTDMPPAVAERVERACKLSPWAREDDGARLAVVAYADHALGEFLGRLESSPLASRSIVVVSADLRTTRPTALSVQVRVRGLRHRGSVRASGLRARGRARRS